MPPKAVRRRAARPTNGQGSSGRGGSTAASASVVDVSSDTASLSEDQPSRSDRAPLPAVSASEDYSFGGLPLEAQTQAADAQTTEINARADTTAPQIKREPGVSEHDDVVMPDAPMISTNTSAANQVVSDSVPGAVEPSSAAPSAPQSASARGGRKSAVAAPRFAGRRSKLARDAAEASASAKRVADQPNTPRQQASRPAGDSATQRGGFSSRGGRGSNRGGFIGDAKGIFGSGMLIKELTSGRRATTQRSATSGSGSGPTRPSGSSSGTTNTSNTNNESKEAVRAQIARVKREHDDEDIQITRTVYNISSSSEDEDAGGKINIDDPSSGEESKVAGYRSGVQLPTRPKRQEHRERGQPSASRSSKVDRKRALKNLETNIKVEASGTKSGTRITTNDAPTEKRTWKGVYASDDDADQSEDRMDIDNKLKTETSERRPDHNHDQAGPQPIAAVDTSHDPDLKPRPRRAPGPDLQTEEEREERDRYLLDLETIVQELRMTAPTDTSGPDEPAEDPRRNNVYLFQFPPVLPDLRTASQMVTKRDPHAEGNGEADAQQDGESVAAAPPPPLAPAPAPAPEAPMLPTTASATGTTSGPRDDAVPSARRKIIKPDPDPAPAEDKTRPTTRLSSGSAGKMRVHASGRVTIDWGGTALALGMGTSVEFLQQVVMARRNEDGEQDDKVAMGGGGAKGKARVNGGEGQVESDGGAGSMSLDRRDVVQPDGVYGGEAMALGQIRGKFIVTPDWDEII